MVERTWAEAARHWSVLRGLTPEPLPGGLINHSLRLGDFVLQRLHPVFAPEVNADIGAITERLASQGVMTPRILPTDTGDLWTEVEGEVWRLMSYVPGQTLHALASAAQARSAGALVGRFHRALAGFDYDYQAQRPQVHDTPAHLRRLQDALEAHRHHRLYEAVAPLAHALLEQAEGRLLQMDLPLRHAHGDLKISNLRFDARDRGLCLLDLDTLAYMPWPLEMGDALRSWCNPRREDELAASLDLSLFAEALRGYAQATQGLITELEWRQLVAGLMQICLELSARFLTDALHEAYFGWDASAYATRGDHNLARGAAMHRLLGDVVDKQGPAQALVEEIFAPV